MTPPHPAPDPAAADTAARAPIVSVLGQRMAVHDFAQDKYVSPVLARHGCFEPFETELVVNEVRPGDVALDLGAHIGYYTLLLARLVGPSGRVVAFEPDPLNYAILCRNVALNGLTNVELHPLAASDRPGRLKLYRSGDNAGDHRLHPAAEDRPAVEVGVVTVDELLAGRAAGVDFVKMDVQGSEGAVLEGMAGVLGRSRLVKMAFEFWPLGLERAGYGAGRLLTRLGSLGFRLYEVDEAGAGVRRADPGRLLERYPASEDRFTNLLAVKAPLPAPEG